MVDSFDFDHDGEINFPEFLVATLDQGYLSQKYLKVAFNYFDTENEGFITAKSMEKCFIRALKPFEDSEISNMIFEAFNKHKVSYEDFEELMSKSLDNRK